MTWVAVAVGGSAILGFMGSQNQADAAQQAAQTQLAGTQYAADIQKQMFDTLNKQQEPYRFAGYGALTRIQDMLPFLTQMPTAQDLQNMPGVQFALNQGMGSARQGMNVLSPGSNADRASQMFATDYTLSKAIPSYLQQRGDIFNTLASIAGIGQKSIGQTTELGSQTGANLSQLAVGGANALAGGQIGAANAQAAGLGGLGNAGMMYALMRPQGGGGTNLNNMINSGYYGQFGITPENAAIAI